jgi:hypothetical protein
VHPGWVGEANPKRIQGCSSADTLVSILAAARSSRASTLSRRDWPSGTSLAGAVDAGNSCGSSSMGLEAHGGGDRGEVVGRVDDKMITFHRQN